LGQNYNREALQTHPPLKDSLWKTVLNVSVSQATHWTYSFIIHLFIYL